ncbi:MAG: hypothetical protein PHF99_12740 [Bacteroidales bacterium]|nr:hypothetical protein [Bacteroidales bacterium]
MVNVKHSKAQLVVYQPQELYSYVLIDYQDYQTFESWELETYERIYLDSTQFVDSLISTERIVGQNFCKIPDTYFTDSMNLLIKVNGFDKNGTIIENEDIVIEYAQGGGSSYWHDHKKWYCNGWQYAYSVNSHRKLYNNLITSTGYLSHESYFQSTEPKMYVYYSDQDWISYTSSPAQAQALATRHGLFTYQLFIDGYRIVTIEDVDSSDDLRDWDGHVITTTQYDFLVGIRKDKGILWRGTAIKTSDIDPISSYWELSDAIDFVNDYANPALNWYTPPIQELECVGYGTYNPDVNEPSAIAMEYVKKDRYFPKPDVSGTLNDNEGSFEDIYDLIDQIGEAFNNESNDEFTWPDGIDKVDIVRISESPSAICTIYEDSIYDANGNIIAPQFTLNKGLYTFSLTHKDKSHNYSIIEVKSMVTSTLDIAELFNITIYPVPIINDYFIIEIGSSISDNLSYELYDKDANSIHNERIRYSTSGGFSGISTIRIDPDNTMPDGNLFNRFIFSDGSVITIQTVKE